LSRSFPSRTHKAAKGFLAALAASLYEVGIRHPQKGMMLRTFTPHQICQSIGWLRYQNACGCDIYIRPADSLGVVMLDDLEATAISGLRSVGLEPCTVVETSPGNFQTWIRLIHNRENRLLDIDLIRRLLGDLASQFGADRNAADWRHFGRLPGFTNRKPSRTLAGKPPFVLLRFACPIVATQGRKHLISLKRRLNISRASKTPVSPPQTFLKTLSYQDRRHRILTFNKGLPWTASPDLSRLDFMIAREMLNQGWPTAMIAQTIKDSPNLKDRKGGHMEGYITRTIDAVLRISTLSPALPISHRNINQARDLIQ